MTSPGSYLRDMREAAGSTAEEVAHKLRFLGLRVATSAILEGLADLEEDRERAGADELGLLFVCFEFRPGIYLALCAAADRPTAPTPERIFANV